jgi:hypothetical protein
MAWPAPTWLADRWDGARPGASSPLASTLIAKFLSAKPIKLFFGHAKCPAEPHDTEPALPPELLQKLR